MNSGFTHITVLLEEAVEALAVRPDGCFLDGTFGRGGHSRLILSHLGPDGRLLGFDKDPQAIATGQALAAEDGRFVIVQRSLPSWARKLRSLAWRARSAAFCWTWAYRLRNSTTQSAVSVS